MPMVKESAAAPAAEAPTTDPGAAYPAPQPPEAREDDVRSMLSMSDKEMRMSYAGILQACIVSQSLYAANNILDRETWRHTVIDEAEYFWQQTLKRTRKE